MVAMVQLWRGERRPRPWQGPNTQQLAARHHQEDSRLTVLLTDTDRHREQRESNYTGILLPGCYLHLFIETELKELNSINSV